MVVLLTAAAGCGPAATPRSSALVPIGQGLMGPMGMRASVYARGVPNASAFALDQSGRLWVTTAAYSDRGTDALYLVEKAGATPRKVMADLKTPLGLLWSNDTLYVSSSGRVDSYGGLQGTRFSLHSTVVTFPAGVGEINNIAQAPDGRLMVGISAPCDHCTPASRWSGTVVSFLPGGEGLSVEATGIRAPFGLAFVPGTSDLIVTMNQRDDLGARTPGDWVALVRPGQNWGFPDCYGQGGASCGAMPKPIAVLEPHAAAGGLVIVIGRPGSATGSAALVTEWALGKVQRVGLTRSGSGLTGSVGPFLTGLKNPLPVAVDADGAVLVGDWKTGVIYRIANG